MKKREIGLGHIDLYSWKPGDKLYAEWMKDYPEDYGYELEVDPNEEILQVGEYTLIIDYPLTTPYKEKLVIKTPWSREQVLSHIVECYKGIYAAEDFTTKIKADNILGMYNRNTTDGTYGIWGHSLDDLMLHTLYVDENNEITLGVDS